MIEALPAIDGSLESMLYAWVPSTAAPGTWCLTK